MRRFHRSLTHALSGLRYAYTREPHLRIHVAVGALALSLAVVFTLPLERFVLLLFMIMLVITIEMINTGVEALLDVTQPRLRWQVRVVKDVMAGAVLVAALGAMTVGLLVFWPALASLASLVRSGIL